MTAKVLIIPKISRQHLLAEASRNPLVKGEGIVCLMFRLLLKYEPLFGYVENDWCILFSLRGSGFSRLLTNDSFYSQSLR